jgi:hypothetical protein
LAKRRKSPTSATTVTATTSATPAHRLERRDDRCHRPVWHQLLDLPRQPVEPGFGILDGVNVVLQHDLLRRMGKAYRGQPTQ